ncbi:Formamidopyrimidine-DNA glycosylase N-terminal domain-containing protein, partial [Thamnocephalis sphaerospora]
MPELPEVERARRLLEDRCVGRYVASVNAANDAIVFCGAVAGAFAALAGRRVLEVGRRGKLFFLRFDRPPALVCHFGMTGNIQFANEAPLQYRRSGKTYTGAEAWPPRFCKLTMRLTSSTTADDADDKECVTWAFTDPRRLGRIRLIDDPLGQPPISELGFDPFITMPALDVFAAGVRRRRMPIKALLLDQKFSAGVGNWIADEVLYQSRLHPGRLTGSLNDEEMTALHQQLRSVCETACAVNADANQFPTDWLFHRRWGKGR